MTTQNCAECGTRAEPGQSFCDACGAVLSWNDRAPRAARTAATAPSAARSTAAADVPAPRASSTWEGSWEEERTAPTARTGTTGRTGAGAPRTGAAGAEGAGAQAHGDVPPRDQAPPRDQVPSRDHGDPHGHGAPRDPGDPRDHRGSEPGGATGTAGPVPATPQPAAHDPAPAAPPAAYGSPPAAHDPAPAAHRTAPAPDPYDTMADRARSLLVPVSEPDGRPAEAPSVAPVLPGRPVADRPQVRAPGHEAGDGHGLPCPWCATPNRPDRHFCARCAMPMTRREEQSRTRLPWWRRLLGAGRHEIPWAGDRPRMRRTFESVLRWVVGAVVLALLIVAGINAPTAVQATRDHFAKRAPVAPDGFGASRSFPGHQPGLAFDKYSNTWWGPGVVDSGQGEWIEARFDEPTRLLDLILTPGVSSKANRIGESALPHRLKATITTKDGRTTTRTITLDQGPGGQRRAFRVGDVTKVRFTVESSYGASSKKQVALAEVEFFGPSRGDNA